jgi:translation elongation factor EF-1beta
MPSGTADPVNPEELSDEIKTEIDALMDYIATTPQNINYNIVREISKAIILNEKHPYFNYYEEKIKAKETVEESKDFSDGKPFEHDPSQEMVDTP